MRVYIYSSGLAVQFDLERWFSFRVHSRLSGGLRLRNYRAVAGNHKFSSLFSAFTCSIL